VKKRGLGFGIQTKLMLAFSLSTIVLAVIMAIVSYTSLKEQSLDEFRRRVLNSVTIAGLQQNGDEFARISSAQDPLYEKFRIQNLAIRNADPQFVYVYTMRKDAAGIYFVVDAGNPGEENFSAYAQRYDDPSDTLIQNFDSMNTAIVEPDVYTDEYGTFLSAYAPIFDSQGKRVGAIGIDILADTIVQRQRALLIQTLLVAAGSMIASIFIGYLFGRYLTNPILRLTNNTYKFASGDFTQRSKIESNDEVEDLSRSFNAMADQLQELVSGLEDRIADRTRELAVANKQNERRAKQFEAIAQVTRTISSTRELEGVLLQIPDLINREFGFYHIGIFLLDTAGEYAVLSAANSKGGKRMLDNGHRLKVGETGIVGYVTATGKPRVALDTGSDMAFFNNPDLPDTHSEIALPLMVGEEIIGALDVQSDQPDAFDQEDVRILGTLADQVSIAIQNARQYEETRSALVEADAISRQFVEAGWSRYSKTWSIEGIRHTGAKATLLYRKAGKLGDTNSSTEENTLRPRTRGTVLSLPIRLRGVVIGSVDVRSPENRQWTDDELDIVNAIIDRAAISLENARLLEDSQILATKERTISEISAKISAQSEVNDLLKVAAQELGRNLPGMEIAIQLLRDREHRND